MKYHLLGFFIIIWLLKALIQPVCMTTDTMSNWMIHAASHADYADATGTTGLSSAGFVRQENQININIS